MRSLMPRRALAALALLALALTATPVARAVPTASVAAQAPNFAAAALRVGMGGTLTVTGLRLETDAQPATLVLQRFRVWSEGARVLVEGGGGVVAQAPPATAYFRGTLAGQPLSSVLLAVNGDGRMTGQVRRANGTWALGAAGAGAAGLASSYVAPATFKAAGKRTFTCGNDGLRPPTVHYDNPSPTGQPAGRAANVSCPDPASGRRVGRGARLGAWRHGQAPRCAQPGGAWTCAAVPRQSCTLAWPVCGPLGLAQVMPAAPADNIAAPAACPPQAASIKDQSRAIVLAIDTDVEFVNLVCWQKKRRL